MLNWGDTLCGVKVTPESWVGGVVEWVGTYRPGNWLKWDDDEAHPMEIKPEYASWGSDADYPGDYQPLSAVDAALYFADYKPIFPPRGFAGKSDAELWDAVSRYAVKTDGFGRGFRLCESVVVCGDLVALGVSGHMHWFGDDDLDIDTLPRAIQQFDNALLLHARLTAVQK